MTHDTQPPPQLIGTRTPTAYIFIYTRCAGGVRVPKLFTGCEQEKLWWRLKTCVKWRNGGGRSPLRKCSRYNPDRVNTLARPPLDPKSGHVGRQCTPLWRGNDRPSGRSRRFPSEVGALDSVNVRIRSNAGLTRSRHAADHRAIDVGLAVVGKPPRTGAREREMATTVDSDSPKYCSLDLEPAVREDVHPCQRGASDHELAVHRDGVVVALATDDVKFRSTVVPNHDRTGQLSGLGKGRR